MLFRSGDGDTKVNSILVALDCTEDVLDEAINNGCDMIVTHHPLIFSGIKRISNKDIIGRIIERAIKNDIIIYSSHTNLDKASEGVSHLIAEKLNLKNCVPLTEEGFGLVGELEEEKSVNEFIDLTKRAYKIETIRGSQPIDAKIKRVAVCGGSGKSFINDAMQKGAQVYVTGDITYHEYYCQNEFMVLDLGHYNSEIDTVKLLAKIISKNFPNFAVSISKKNNNPVYYY